MKILFAYNGADLDFVVGIICSKWRYDDSMRHNSAAPCNYNRRNQDRSYPRMKSRQFDDCCLVETIPPQACKCKGKLQANARTRDRIGWARWDIPHRDRVDWRTVMVATECRPETKTGANRLPQFKDNMEVVWFSRQRFRGKQGPCWKWRPMGNNHLERIQSFDLNKPT